MKKDKHTLPSLHLKLEVSCKRELRSGGRKSKFNMERSQYPAVAFLA